MMDEVAVIEKLLGGTVSAVVILGFVAWKLWQRMNARDLQTDALVREVLQGLSASTHAMTRTADAVDALREAIERGEQRPARQSPYQ